MSLENYSSISCGKQGLFYGGLYSDIALLTEFYFQPYINSIPIPFHICAAVGALKKCVEESCWLSCEVMEGWYLALKKRKSFQKFLKNRSGFIPRKLNKIKITRQSNYIVE